MRNFLMLLTSDTDEKGLHTSNVRGRHKELDWLIFHLRKIYVYFCETMCAIVMICSGYATCNWFYSHNFIVVLKWNALLSVEIYTFDATHCIVNSQKAKILCVNYVMVKTWNDSCYIVYFHIVCNAVNAFGVKIIWQRVVIF